MSVASKRAVDEMLREERIRDAAFQMLIALKAGSEALRKEIAEGGGCDHSVGICWCPVIRIADQMDDAIGVAEGRQ